MRFLESRCRVDNILDDLEPLFREMYSHTGRPSIPPEQLLRASLLQVLYSIRSERTLVEQLDYNLLFRWFVGLSMDGKIWNHSTFSKNRDRLMQFEVATLHLDSKNRILCYDLVSVGSMTASIVHPREVYKSALLSTASGLVFLHNLCRAPHKLCNVKLPVM
ncbi:transposase [Geoalkalibacter halelectricus]|uniref:transposase n=1 Tax=Geoalkalibacter halelectricus TaxID=2847045 RepID=UPI0036F42758